MPKKIRKTPLALVIQSLLVLPAAVSAQTLAQTPAPTSNLDTVVVTGIRAATRNALDAMEASNSMVETIALPSATVRPVRRKAMNSAIRANSACAPRMP